MKETKKKILETALRLFNKDGIKNVTLHKIATELGISQGNLNYHFKTKQDIVEALYFELVNKMNEVMENMSRHFSLLTRLYESAGKTMNIFYQYRFFMRDIYIILKENEKIKTHYLELQHIRKVQFMEIFQGLISSQIMREEEFDNEYERLFKRMNILGDNWINAQELLKGELENPVQYYKTLLFEIIYPYLTAKGKEQYQSIKPQQK